MSNILITGSGGGIGTALAKAFLREGHNLLLHYRNRECDLESEHMFNSQIEFVKGDLRDEHVASLLIRKARDFEIDVLINNAGVHLVKPFDEKEANELREEMEVNFAVPMILTRCLWETLSSTSSLGLVVNINSVAGRNGAAGESVYCASKHALAGFGKALQFDGTKWNVRVLNVVLGAVKTTMTEQRSDYNKLMDPNEVASVIVQLCEMKRKYQTLNVDEVMLSRRIY